MDGARDDATMPGLSLRMAREARVIFGATTSITVHASRYCRDSSDIFRWQAVMARTRKHIGVIPIKRL